MKNGKFDKDGDFQPVSWDQALDVMADKWKAALKKQGPSGVGMFGSGQWTIMEGYAASKMMKAGSVKQYRSKCSSLYGICCRWLYAYLRY